MVVRRTSIRKKSNPIASFLADKVFTSQALPLILVVSVLGIMFVLTRIKGIEQDYKYNEIAKRIKIQKDRNKELKATKARELSVKNLKAFARKFDLKAPTEKKIIIIP